MKNRIILTQSQKDYLAQCKVVTSSDFGKTWREISPKTAAAYARKGKLVKTVHPGETVETAKVCEY